MVPMGLPCSSMKKMRRPGSSTSLLSQSRVSSWIAKRLGRDGCNQFDLRRAYLAQREFSVPGSWTLDFVHIEFHMEFRKVKCCPLGLGECHPRGDAPIAPQQQAFGLVLLSKLLRSRQKSQSDAATPICRVNQAI